MFSSPISGKAFTVAEANFLVPTLEGVLSRIDEKMEGMRRSSERLQLLDLVWGVSVEDPQNPDHEEAAGCRDQLTELSAEIEDLVHREIDGRGLRFPSGGLEHGLIDFPTTWEGRWVFLCWRRGEPVVEAWHEIEGGFAGRQELTPQQIREMGRGQAF